MLQYRAYLLDVKRPVEGQQVQNEVIRMSNEAGTYCAGCTVGVSTLSNGLR